MSQLEHIQSQFFKLHRTQQFLRRSAVLHERQIFRDLAVLTAEAAKQRTSSVAFRPIVVTNTDQMNWVIVLIGQWANWPIMVTNTSQMKWVKLCWFIQLNLSGAWAPVKRRTSHVPNLMLMSKFYATIRHKWSSTFKPGLTVTVPLDISTRLPFIKGSSFDFVSKKCCVDSSSTVRSRLIEWTSRTHSTNLWLLLVCLLITFLCKVNPFVISRKGICLFDWHIPLRAR